MHKVIVLKKFSDEDGVVYPCFQQNDQGHYLLDNRGRRMPVIMQMKDKVAEYALDKGFIEVLEKPKPKPKPKPKKAKKDV